MLTWQATLWYFCNSERLQRGQGISSELILASMDLNDLGWGAYPSFLRRFALLGLVHLGYGLLHSRAKGFGVWLRLLSGS